MKKKMDTEFSEDIQTLFHQSKKILTLQFLMAWVITRTPNSYAKKL